MSQDVADVRYEGVHCQVTIGRPTTRVVVLSLTGWDVGEFGDIPMQELARDLGGCNTMELYIDARDVRGASIEVSAEWAQWLGKHRSHFEHISMLTGSPFIRVTANFVRRFGELGDIMRIYSDPIAFDAALEQSIARASLS